MGRGRQKAKQLHMGHYFGTLRSRVEMQNKGVHTNIIIADYQVITDRDTTEHIQDNVLNLILDYMAAGIAPNKTMIFTHSAVPAENQLMLPFLSLVTRVEGDAALGIGRALLDELGGFLGGGAQHDGVAVRLAHLAAVETRNLRCLRQNGTATRP